MTTRYLAIKASKEGIETLELYCQQTSRTKTDVIREYLRYLKERQKVWQVCLYDLPN